MIGHIRRKIRAIVWHESWMIGWIDAPIEQSLDWKVCPPVRWVGTRSSRRYLADPFAWPGLAGVILCEEYDFAARLGRIRRLEIDGTAIRGEAPEDIPLPGHLSYPFLFEHGGDVYCLPESYGAGRLALLRWRDGRWETFATPLPQTAAADSILFVHGGYFWIAYTDTALGHFDNLNLCYAERLGGPWLPHQQNPVKRDARSARCGGTPFRRDGRLYRPAQDCSRGYGKAIRIMEVVDCTPAAFREQEVTAILPVPGMNPDGFHTLSAWGDKCLIDGKRMMISPGQVLAKAARRLKTLL